MAIPISWPSSDDVEDSYRSLDILLEQLLVTVRQVLVQRRRQNAITANTRQRASHQVPRPQAPTQARTPPVVAAPQPTRLPDLLDNLTNQPECESPTRSRKSSATEPPMTPAPGPPSVWVQTGAELRHIADSFRVHHGINPSTLDGKTQLAKESSLLALLCPGLSKSLWTTLALLLGWGFFTRKR